ncbi:MAG: TrmH family RNA methyltransferase, partial [Pseudomonadota bacterium]
GAAPDGAEEMHACDWPRRAPLLVLGDERKGLSAQQLALCKRSVRIPMTGKADSLNLGVAGSLLLYEVLRARRRLF